MADNPTLDNADLADITIATDEVAVNGTQGVAQVQYVKLVDGTPGGTAAIAGTASGLEVSVQEIAAGDNNIGNVDVVTLPALPAGANNIGDVDVLTIPVRLRTTDAVSSAIQTDAIMNGFTALTPKFAFANVAASQTDAAVVAAVGGKKIRVLAVAVQPAATATTVTFNSKPAGAGTAISSAWACPANAGPQRGFNPVGWFETVSGEGLSVTTGSGSTVGIDVVYVEV